MSHSDPSREPGLAHKVVAAVSPPWNGFVAAFLYYTLLTLITIGGVDLSFAFMVVSYALPVAAYGALLATRAARALAAMPIEIGETPHALAR